MLQYSKLIQSREDWKRKAVERSEALREQRKAHKRSQAKIAELKAQLRTEPVEATVKKKN